MKISLITLHRIVNYGSVLQAFATQNVLEQLGFEVEIIDYFTERMTQKGMSQRIRYKSPKLEKSLLLTAAARIIMYPSYKKRFAVFSEFVKRYLKLTPHTYTCEEDFKRYPIEADFYCTGSDQTWNSIWNERFDSPMYLSFAPDDKPKFSYAASFGRKKLEEWEVEPTRKYLSRYSHLAMREDSGVEILSGLGLTGLHVPDPTLLLTRADWQPLISSRYSGQKYILVYNINREKGLDDYAQRLSKEKGLPVYFMSYQYHDFYKKGKLICCPRVSEFLGLIANAQYVITDSFHCTAFSTNFHKQLMVYYPHKFSTRLESLVNLTGQQKRVVHADSPLSLADEPIDFDYVSCRLEAERKKALEYLKDALGVKEESYESH